MTVIGRRSASVPDLGWVGKRAWAKWPVVPRQREGPRLERRGERGDRVEEFSPVADDRDAEILQIFGRQARQEVAVDRVFAERRFVLPETEVLEPGRDVHGRLQSAEWDNHLGPVVCKASTSSRPGRTAGQCPIDAFQPKTAFLRLSNNQEPLSGGFDYKRSSNGL